MTDNPSDKLALALDPRSIAVIGASDNPNKIGGRPLAFLQRFGYRGRVYAVNPTRSTTQGFATVPSVDALPEVVDLAVIAVPGEAGVDAVRACAARGVAVAVVISSGFGETGPEGERAQRALVEIARAGGMRVIGPNTQGLANFRNGAVTSFSTMFLETVPQDGPVGIVSQSGAMSGVPYALLRERGIGVRHVHATGNDADVSVGDLAALVAADPDVRLLLLYLEGLRDAEPIARAAQIARARGLPIIALKAGRTAAGQAAAGSHTGALANDDRVVSAFFEQHGIYRARSIGDCVDAAELYLRGWKPKGRRLVAISNSGAVCVQTVDAAADSGLEMATLDSATRGELAAILPSFATTTNPVDITAALLGNSRLFSNILPVIARDPAADVFLIGIPVAGTGYDVAAFARDTADFAARTEKPVVVSAGLPVVAQPFREAGLAVYRTEFEAVRALGQFVSHQVLMAEARGGSPGQPRQRTAVDARPSVSLNEADSLELAAAHGIATARFRLCRSADEARRAWHELGPRVVVKGCSAELPHKSEHDLVEIDPGSEDAVAEAFARFAMLVSVLGVRFDGVIVAEMVRGGAELMAGAHRDPVFGPVIVFGAGGKYVEAMPDAELLLPPFEPRHVAAKLQSLRIAPILRGVRGEAPLDVEAFCALVAALGRWVEIDPTIASIDLNPVILGPVKSGARAVDAVVFRYPA